MVTLAARSPSDSGGAGILTWAGDPRLFRGGETLADSRPEQGDLELRSGVKSFQQHGEPVGHLGVRHVDVNGELAVQL